MTMSQHKKAKKSETFHFQQKNKKMRLAQINKLSTSKGFIFLFEQKMDFFFSFKQQ